jgi:hypothetical protein
VSLTDKQHSYITTLLSERQIPEQPLRRALEMLPTLSKAQASKWIERLQELPHIVPEGYYALPTEPDTATQDLAFYHIQRPTQGNWTGWTFVKHCVGPEEHRLSQASGRAIIQRIKSYGPEESCRLYGMEIGRCGICGLRLTNTLSRALGIGPICRQNSGWA